jgi:hypothetical protein
MDAIWAGSCDRPRSRIRGLGPKERLPFQIRAYVVYLETNQIEKIADPAYLHGFSIKRKDGNQFYLYYVIRFPEPLQDLPKGIEKYYTVLDGGRALRSKEEFVWELSRSFVFSESDPVGVYQLEVYVDAELYRKIDYDVLPELKVTF